MSGKAKITVAHGDGIGPEIMKATLNILEAAGAQLDLEEIEIGEKVYLNGISSGIEPAAWDSLRRTKVFLKAPITTPQGGGFKSLNVTTRKTLGLYANVRPCISYHPYIETKHPGLDLVVIRENEEDLYAGIEHQQTPEVVQCLKLVSRPGCEKIVRYAFEYARAYNRKKVTCFSKDNIMKLTDGLFHGIFDEIGAEYPDIEKEHMIIDIGSAIVADDPRHLDVVVTLNLYGDIISDIAAQITGSVGLGGSANIGKEVAMFEAIHGSAPDIAGKNLANPSGLLNASVMMLTHIGQADVASKVRNAWLCTLEDGIHTGDIYKDGVSKEKVGTQEFAQAVIERLGKEPTTLKSVHFQAVNSEKLTYTKPEGPRPEKVLLGVDVFIDWDNEPRDPNIIGKALDGLGATNLKLKMITNRGVKVYPDGHPETFSTDHWRCRFIARNEGTVLGKQDIIELLQLVEGAGFDFIKTENLYSIGGERAYSLGQGE